MRIECKKTCSHCPKKGCKDCPKKKKDKKHPKGARVLWLAPRAEVRDSVLVTAMSERHSLE